MTQQTPPLGDDTTTPPHEREQPGPAGDPLRFDFSPWDFRTAAPREAHQEQDAYLDQLRRRGYHIGEQCFVSRLAAVHPDTLELDDRTYIAAHAYVSGDIRLGADCTVNPFAVIRGTVVAGDGVRIGAHSSLLGFNHTFADVTRPMFRQPVESRGITIGDDVWIGSQVVVLDGVRIGAHSVIGAGAVVTKDIPQWSVAVGNPARVVRSRLADLPAVPDAAAPHPDPMSATLAPASAAGDSPDGRAAARVGVPGDSSGVRTGDLGGAAACAAAAASGVRVAVSGDLLGGDAETAVPSDSPDGDVAAWVGVPHGSAVANVDEGDTRCAGVAGRDALAAAWDESREEAAKCPGQTVAAHGAPRSRESQAPAIAAVRRGDGHHRAAHPGTPGDTALAAQLADLAALAREQLPGILERAWDSTLGRYRNTPGQPPTVRAHCDAVELADLLLGAPPQQLSATDHITRLQGWQDSATGLVTELGPDGAQVPQRPSLDGDATYHVLCVGYALDLLGAAFPHGISAVMDLGAEGLSALLAQQDWASHAWHAGHMTDMLGTALLWGLRTEAALAGAAPNDEPGGTASGTGCVTGARRVAGRGAGAAGGAAAGAMSGGVVPGAQIASRGDAGAAAQSAGLVGVGAVFRSASAASVGALAQSADAAHGTASESGGAAGARAERAGAACRQLDALMNWLVAHADPRSGMWGGSAPVADEAPLLDMVNGFYRATRGTFAQFGVALPYPRAVIDTVLRHAASRALAAGRENACNVLDIIHPLWLASRQEPGYRRDEIRDVAREQLSRLPARWEPGRGFAFAAARGGEGATQLEPSLQGTEMWLATAWLAADLLGIAGSLGYRPRGIHRPEPAQI